MCAHSICTPLLFPLFALHLIATIVYAILHPRDWMNWWQVIMAVALLLFLWAARLMALTRSCPGCAARCSTAR